MKTFAGSVKKELVIDEENGSISRSIARVPRVVLDITYGPPYHKSWK